MSAATATATASAMPASTAATAATAGMTTSMTLGMRLDMLVDQMNSLSSTQLYGVIVVVTCLVCLVLLGTGQNGHLDLDLDLEVAKAAAASAAAKASTASTNTSASSMINNKQPRWHLFKYVNLLASALFLVSIGLLAWNPTYVMVMEHYLNSFLIGWSVLLCYCFGFFGVSLIHGHLPPQEQQQTQTQNQDKATKAHKLHPPAVSTPVCSDQAFSGTKKTVYDSTTTTTSTSTTSNNNNNNSMVVDFATLSNEEIAQMVLTNKLKDHELEKKLDAFQAVAVRRLACAQKLKSLQQQPQQVSSSSASSASSSFNPLAKLPSTPSLDYGKVHGANCEIVIGYVPLPVGLVGPLTLNQESVYVPMATTEGCLVASTNRGAKALTQGGGAFAKVLQDGITRAPCVRMNSAMEAADLKIWCETPTNFQKLKHAFESTTSFGKLKTCQPTVAGRNVYIRLVCFSGDAMGMNMVSKGSLAVIELLQQQFPSLQLVALSGNMCTDKKAAATNWLHGRGKSVVVEATIPKAVVATTLKTTVEAMVHTNLHKNLIGSAMAGALGGFNAHASNIVTAIFLATGQDPAQNVESSNCITLMEATDAGDLWISCTMPSIEVGTVGGGTSLEAQRSCLEMIGCAGGSSHQDTPGTNAQKLATVVAAATMAGELSLLAALAANTLVQAHMTHNRKKK